MDTRITEEINSNSFHIQTQFELLKYIGGKDNKRQASGEGIPIDIILLPDLVLDIRKYNLDNADINQKCIAIGGRSGRVSCILAHLTELYDGIYRPHLVAKTGNLGKLLLENEFFNKQNINDSRKLISHIVEREGEPRVTIWDDPKNIFNSRRSFTKNEINAEELKNNGFLREVITKCRVIYFSSIKSPNFENTLSFLVKEIKDTSVKIYIDCTRSDKKHLLALKAVISGQDFNTSNIEGIIISVEERESLKLCWKDYKNDLKRKHIGILFYSNSKIEYFDKEGIPTDEIDIRIAFDNEDIPERFKAGFLLAKSVYETVHNLSNEITKEQESFIQNINDFFVKFWENDPIRKMILYGIGIATAKSNKFGYCDLESIFGDQKELFPTKRYPITLSTYNIIRNSKHLEIKSENIKDIIRLSGYRRNNLLPNTENHGRSHNTCQNNKDCKYFKSLDTEKKDIYPYSAILLDLDGTLMDSSVERNRGLSSALKIINSALEIESQSVVIFEEYVYNNWPLFKALGKGDFRQEWNLKGWYIAYILFSQNKNLLKRIRNDLASIDEPENNIDRIKVLISSADWRKEIVEKYLQIENKHEELIDKAIQEFNNIKLFAYKEAFDFLKSLQDSKMYNLYIVSEGNSETQWLKLKSTGLSEFFPRVKVLTTDDAANLNKQISSLNQEKVFINNKLKETISEITRTKDSMHDFSDFKIDLTTKLSKVARAVPVIAGDIRKVLSTAASQFNDEHFQKRNDQIDRNKELYDNRKNTIEFIETLLKRLNTKGGVSFYAAIIRAIFNNPDAPLESLRDFEKLIDTELPDSPYKFAMIGDRQKNDIKPVIKLLERKRILTLRLLAGKYYEKEPYSDNNYASSDPDYLVHTLAQAKVLLLSDNIWDNKICTYDTSFFCLKIELDKSKRIYTPSENEILNPESVSVSVGLDIILTGIEMPSAIYPLTNKICRKILKEFILLNQDIDLKPILEEIGLFVDHLEEDTIELIRKTRLLTSLVNDTKLQNKYLRQYKDKLKKRLEESQHAINDRVYDTSELNHIETALNIIDHVHI